MGRTANRAILLALVMTAWSLSGQSARAERQINAEAYRDKLKGMWLGEILGNYAGRPVEGHGSNDREPLSYQVDWNDVVITNTWDGDDDTCFEYLYVSQLAANPTPTSQQIADLWTGSMNDVAFYIANRQARWQMSLGQVPPQTGSRSWNVKWAAIDSQITTDRKSVV